MPKDEQGFDEFVRARLPHLLRFGRALTCNDAAAGALVEESLTPVLAAWDARSELGAEDIVRRGMVHRYLRHNGVHRGADNPDVTRDAAVWDQLTQLTPRNRALVALRCHEELSEGQVADVLHCSPGTVRGLTGQALAELDEDRVRRTLDEPVILDETRLITAVRDGAVRRRRRRTLVVAAVVGLVVGVVATLAAVAAVRKPAAEVPPPGLEPNAFAVTAAGPDRLWAITFDPDCDSCSLLWVGDGTPDGWKQRHTFQNPALVARLVMAPNGKDGWAWFGRDFLQATHDGGRTWVVPGVDMRQDDVDVQLAGSSVYVLLHSPADVHLWRSEVGTDNWEELPLTGRAGSDFTLTAIGERVILVEDRPGRHPMLRPIDGKGKAHRLPCLPQPLAPQATAGALWVSCMDVGEGVTIIRSTDGATWQQVGVSPLTAAGTYPISDQQTFVVTRDGGRLLGDGSAVDVPFKRLDAEAVSDGIFVDPQTGFLLTDRGRILRTDDGAHSWTEIG